MKKAIGFFLKQQLTLLIVLPALLFTVPLSAHPLLDASLLKQIQHILVDIKTFQSAFIQETVDQTQEGMLYIKRPGKMRLEYNAPSSLLLIAQKDWLTQYNKNTGQAEQILIEDTPAAFLLNAHKNFKKHFSVKKWQLQAGLLTIEVGSDVLDNLDMKLTVVFEMQPFALKQWITEDATGYQTKVTLFNWVINPKVSDSLFIPPALPL